VRPVELAAQHGTPTYVYDLAAVRRAHADLRRCLPRPSELYYSLKANPHPDVVAQLAGLGCRAEVSSTGEIDAALGAGIVADHVMLTGPGKTDETIDHALARGVCRFSVDSPGDLRRVGDRAAARAVEVGCLLRVNADERVPGLAMTMTGTASQFGADAAWVAREPERFRRAGPARVRGLHLYMGTNLDDEDRLMSQFDVGVRLAGRLAWRLGGIEEVDLGGGFGAPFARHGERPRLPALAGRLEALLDEHLRGWRDGQPRVTFESGRYLVADCGTLLCRVVDVKPSGCETFIVLDAGVNHLGGMSGLKRLPRIVPDLQPHEARPSSDRLTGAVVVGPLCTPLDVFCRGVELPSLVPGDVVSIPNVGAYGLTASLLAFLGHRPPLEVVVDSDDLVSASRLTLVRSTVDGLAGAAPHALVDARSSP
jgi:diaminopimelate decarboxylase